MNPEKYLQSKTKKKYTVKKRVYEKRNFTADDLKAYWLNNNIRSKRHLLKVRQPGEPTPYDYIKTYGSFSKTKEIIEGTKNEFFLEYSNPDKKYFVDLVQQFKIPSKAAYRFWRSKLPEAFPSIYFMEKAWGNWSNLKYFCEIYSYKNTMRTYIKLADKLGRIPSHIDCGENQLPITHLIKKFGGKRQLDTVLKMLLDYRR